ncbi:hypothetical protein [Colwellia echini]|uniref:Uncharacterized protein n=1 Tax=Colwellia echini TaxID=1982103 RepID=A0ABY3N0K7_9GAMM|nr:hypothetical protein [Colwellia echini]TYK66983.1 hypothetical protein CWS31_000095 [Colwellia echini]
MSFFKSLCLAILATLFLTYVFGASLLEWTNLQVTMNGEAIEPIKAIGFSALVTVLLVIAALAIVLSVFGGIVFIGLIIVGSIAMFTLGVFWPVLLIALVIWLLTSNKGAKQMKNQSTKHTA